MISSRMLTAIRILIYALVPVGIGICALVELNLSGIRHIQQRPGIPSAMVSQLFPAARLAGAIDGTQQVRMQPVYVTVRYPHRYDRIMVRAHVLNPGGLAWRIGLESGDGTEWQYTVHKPDATGATAFDLRQARITNGRVRIMITVDGLDEEHTFTIQGIEVVLQREPLLATIFRRMNL